MLKIFVSVLLSMILFFPSFSVAEETVEEPLMVPETQDVPEEISIDTEAPEQHEEIPTETIEPSSTDEVSQENTTHNVQASDGNAEMSDTDQEEVQQYQPAQSEVPAEEVQEIEKPSQEEIEAQQAEEAELRESGVGEEPIAE